MLVSVLVVMSIVWVGLDARRLGVRAGSRAGRRLDWSAGQWVVGCVLLWLVVLPLYLAVRPSYVRAQRRRSEQPVPAGSVGRGA